MSSLILYTTDDGKSQIQLWANAWAEFDNVGEEPTLLQWGENQ
jgi:hypothetical protein